MSQGGSGGLVEPAFQCVPLPALRQDQNPESQFTQNHRIDDEVSFLFAKPGQDTWIQQRFGGLAQDVGVNQIFHNSASVGGFPPLEGAASIQRRWARRRPSAGRRAASRLHPRSAGAHAGPDDSLRGPDARCRTPVPFPRGPTAGTLQAERFDPWMRYSLHIGKDIALLASAARSVRRHDLDKSVLRYREAGKAQAKGLLPKAMACQQTARNRSATEFASLRQS